MMRYIRNFFTRYEDNRLVIGVVGLVCGALLLVLMLTLASKGPQQADPAVTSTTVVAADGSTMPPAATNSSSTTDVPDAIEDKNADDTKPENRETFDTQLAPPDTRPDGTPAYHEGANGVPLTTGTQLIAMQRATDFVTAWGTPGASMEEWMAGMDPYITGTFRDQLRTAAHENLDTVHVTGPARMETLSDVIYVQVPTDIGVMRVGISTVAIYRGKIDVMNIEPLIN